MATICLVRQYYYPLDTRVRREVEALVGAGHQVDVICMRAPGEPASERHGSLRIKRLPMHHQRGGKLSYIGEYIAFLLLATAVVGLRFLWRRYAVVQVNSLPDTLVFAAVVPKLFGARVLLDLHECMPEFFATKFDTEMGHPMVRAVGWAEQASIGFADRVITCTEQQREAFVNRGAPAAKIAVILNSADEAIFDAGRYPHQGRQPGRFTLICHGSVEERYGLDTAIRAVALLKDEIPELCFQIYGDGAQLGELRRLARDLGVEEMIYFSNGFVPLDELLNAISHADAGIVAMKRDVFRDLTHCNKMYDFIAMGVPTISSRTRSVEAYFPPTSFLFFEADDAADLARAIRELYADQKLGERLIAEANRVNEAYRWPAQRERYLVIIRRLAGRRSPARPAVTAEGRGR